MASMPPVGEKIAVVSGVCTREEITVIFLLEGGACVHPFTRVLQAMHFAENAQAVQFHICPTAAA